MRWSWPLDAWRILINHIRSWSPWSRRILYTLIFKNKPFSNRICILFELHQKRKLAGAWKENCVCRTALITRLMPSRLIPSISQLIKLISRLLYFISFLHLSLYLSYLTNTLDQSIGSLVSRPYSRLTFLDLLLFFCFKPSSFLTRLDLLGPSSPLENNAKS